MNNETIEQNQWQKPSHFMTTAHGFLLQPRVLLEVSSSSTSSLGTPSHIPLSLFPLILYIKYPSKAKWDDKGESKAMHASTLFPFPRLNLSFSSFSQLLCMLNLEGYTNRNPFLIDFEQYTFWELQSNIITFPRWFLMENAHLPFLWYFC